MQERTTSGIGAVSQTTAHRRARRRGSVAGAVFGGLLAVAWLGFAAEDGGEKAPGSQFLRFVETGSGEGRLETSVVRYRRADGVEVDLIAAVHVGDGAYYRELQRRFTSYDALLYEMIKDEGVEIDPSRRSDSLLSTFQRGLKGMLELEFQLDAIDYSAKNFVHADMDPATFLRLQREKGESVLSLMFAATVEEWRRQLEGKGSQLTGFHLLAAFLSRDRAHALKYLLAREFEGIEDSLAGVDRGADGEGSVLLSGRNRVAIRVMEREIGRGRRRLGIFYGAGHMTDLEKRLYREGFRRDGQSWLTAWDVERRTRAGDGTDGGAKGKGSEAPPGESGEAGGAPGAGGRKVRVSLEPEPAR